MTREERTFAQREQITYWLRYFRDNKMEHGDLELQVRLTKFIISMLSIQLDDMGISLDNVDLNIETKVISNSLGSFFYNKDVENGHLIERGKPWYEFNLAYYLRELESDKSHIRMNGIRDLSTTIFHETRHHRQHLMVEKNISSKEAFMYAREFLLMDRFGRTFYERNYMDLAIESDAQNAAIEQYLNIKDDMEFSDYISFYRMKLVNGRYIYGVDNLIDERNDLGITAEKICIVDNKEAEWVIRYPILQKFYNMDGSRKDCVELIKNMNLELQTFSDSTQLTLEEKQKMKKECKEMYYELIYQSLEWGTFEQVESIKQLDPDEVKSLFKDMSNYFQHELESKVQASEKYTELRSEYPKNEYGIIKVAINGREVNLTIDEYIKTFDTNMMGEKYVFPEDNNLKVTAEELVRKYIIKYVPVSGYIVDSNNEKFTAREFIESLLPSLVEAKQILPDWDFDKIIRWLLKDIVKPTKWINHQEEKMRLDKYYGRRQKILSEVGKELFDQEKSLEETSNVLKSAVIATEEGTRTGKINQQLQCLIALEENKDEKQVKLEIER